MAQLHPLLRMQLNVAAGSTGSPLLLDAIAQYEPFSAFKRGGVLDPAFNEAVGIYAQAGYMPPVQLGPGRLQFIGRYQLLDELGSRTRRTREDLTSTYVVMGHPLRVSLVLSRDIAADAAARYSVRLRAVHD